jgi:hypothetical protein
VAAAADVANEVLPVLTRHADVAEQKVGVLSARSQGRACDVVMVNAAPNKRAAQPISAVHGPRPWRFSGDCGMHRCVLGFAGRTTVSLRE